MILFERGVTSDLSGQRDSSDVCTRHFDVKQRGKNHEAC